MISLKQYSRMLLMIQNKRKLNFTDISLEIWHSAQKLIIQMHYTYNGLYPNCPIPTYA